MKNASVGKVGFQIEPAPADFAKITNCRFMDLV